MRRAISSVALALVCGCSPSGGQNDPRDRAGANTGPVAWRVVAQGDGHAAFLSRPGTAPDIVLWCRNRDEITLRAHVFDMPAANPDLKLEAGGGNLIFPQVRRQGGVRSGDRILVEGTAPMNDAKVAALLSATNSLVLSSGAETFRAVNADPANVMPDFVVACQALAAATPTPTPSPSK
jgi:hypothetical protein